MASLAETIFANPDKSNLRIGVITQHTPDVIVELAGGEIRNPGLLNGVLPALGLPVALFRQDSTWLLLGSVETP